MAERVVVMWRKKVAGSVGRVAASDGVAFTICRTLRSIHPTRSDCASRGQSASA